MFVVKTDFDIQPYTIPNLSGNNNFLDYVEREEEDILKSLLGKSLYDAFIDGLDTDYPEDRWVDLRDGADYIYLEKTYEWVGMKKMLIPYIFSMWLRDTFDNNSGIGVVVAKGENSKIINPGNRISRNFNEFSRIASNCKDQKNTLYGFLYNKGLSGEYDDIFGSEFETFGQYLNFVFKDPGRMNTFQL